MKELTDSKHILSFGGGVNTVALMIHLLRTRQPLDEVVFADTGGEVPETYAYLNIAEAFLARHNISFKVLTADVAGGNLYDCAWRRRVTPSAIWRWSTRDFKVKPIYAYYRSLQAHIYQYMGIAYDEVDRMKDSGVPYVTNVYPLVDGEFTREDCVRIIEETGLPVPVKSGCFFCPFNTLERWEWLHKNHGNLYWKAVALEENSKHFPKQRLTDEVFRRRAQVTLRELAERFEKKGLLPEPERVSACGGHCMT